MTSEEAKRMTELAKPCVGCIVHYHAPGAAIIGNKPRAGIITEVHDAEGLVSLTLFSSTDTVLTILKAPFAEAPRPGHWNYLPTDYATQPRFFEQARTSQPPQPVDPVGAAAQAERARLDAAERNRQVR